LLPAVPSGELSGQPNVAVLRGHPGSECGRRSTPHMNVDHRKGWQHPHHALRLSGSEPVTNVRRFRVTGSTNAMTDTRRKAKGGHSGRVGKYDVELPEGVTAADWGLERVRVQNPSIRSYLGCIRLLEEVLDSNYAILHCSRDRLLKIWRQVEQVCQHMRSEILPTLKEPSVIPSLDHARRHAAASFRELVETVLTAMERYDHPLRADQLPEVRKLLCVSIGKIHAFLRDTFGEIVANDPRSRYDAAYFLSRRFTPALESPHSLY